MPKRITQRTAPQFGARLVKLLQDNGQPRRGAGAYLEKRYGVSNVTANAWLNGEHRADPSTAERIARDHGVTFAELYFGSPATPLGVRDDPGDFRHDRRITSADALGWLASALDDASPGVAASIGVLLEKFAISPDDRRQLTAAIQALLGERSD